MPCGNRIRPSPKAFTSLPEASNLRTGGSFLPAQLLTPQRSATQILLPSRSTSTALVDPHILPSGSFAQFSMVTYGLGCEFGVASVCAQAKAAIQRAELTSSVTRFGVPMTIY